MFEWDPVKAKSNLRKHRIDFDLAATAFGDPLSTSIRDEDRCGFEERWMTLGQARDGQLLVVVHADRRTHGDEISVRIISARRATRNERRQYEPGE